MFLTTKEASFRIDSSMFVVEGSWETGYALTDDLIVILDLGIEDAIPVGSKSCILNLKDIKVFEEMCSCLLEQNVRGHAYADLQDMEAAYWYGL